MIGIGIGLVGGSVTSQLPFRFTINTNNTSAGSSTSTQFKLPLVSSGTLNAVVNWGDGTSSTITAWNQAEVTHTYATAGSYDVRITGVLRGWQFNNGGDKLKILNIINWSGLIISVDSGFYGCTNLTASAIDAPTITGTSLANYFRGCSNFNGAVGNWTVSSVTDLSTMFFFASAFNQNIGSWNTSSVINMYAFLAYANVFNNGGSPDINNLNTSSVTNIFALFEGSPAFNQPVGNWNTSSVINMNSVFNSATAFNQNIGSWNVSNVTSFSGFMASKTAADYSASNLDAIYNGWSSRPVQPNLSINFGTIKYTAAGQVGKNILDFAPNNWTLVDGGI